MYIFADFAKSLKKIPQIRNISLRNGALAITSENKPKRLSHFRSAQFRYALVYIAITLVALLFLNIYSSNFTQDLFYNNKKTAMIEKCHLVAREISDLDTINNETIANSFLNYIYTTSDILKAFKHKTISQ
jgi:hypothetical protein